MTVLGIVWVVIAPYCTGLAVAWSRRANRLVHRHLAVSTAIGWCALAAMFAGVFAVSGHTGGLIALASAPFVGLAVWKTQRGPDDDDGSPAEPDDHPPVPDGIARTRIRLRAPRRTRPTGHRPVRPARTRTPI